MHLFFRSSTQNQLIDNTAQMTRWGKAMKELRARDLRIPSLRIRQAAHRAARKKSLKPMATKRTAAAQKKPSLWQRFTNWYVQRRLSGSPMSRAIYQHRAARDE